MSSSTTKHNRSDVRQVEEQTSFSWQVLQASLKKERSTMEYGNYLALMVAGVGALHLFARVTTYLAKNQTQQKPAGHKAESIDSQPDDWYVFFQCSALTGTRSSGPQTTSKTTTASPKRPRADRRRRQAMQL